MGHNTFILEHIFVSISSRENNAQRLPLFFVFKTGNLIENKTQSN